MRQRVRRVLTLPFIVALAVWSFLAYLFVFVLAGAHVCTILQPIPDVVGTTIAPTLAPLTAADYAAATAACNRPDVGAIAVFTVGYVVIASIAVRRASE